MQSIVNVIPVIAKADSFKPNELFKMKLDIINTAIDRGVKFFDCNLAIGNVSKNVRTTAQVNAMFYIV